MNNWPVKDELIASEVNSIYQKDHSIHDYKESIKKFFKNLRIVVNKKIDDLEKSDLEIAEQVKESRSQFKRKYKELCRFYELQQMVVATNTSLTEKI